MCVGKGAERGGGGEGGGALEKAAAFWKTAAFRAIEQVGHQSINTFSCFFYSTSVLIKVAHSPLMIPFFA